MPALLRMTIALAIVGACAVAVVLVCPAGTVWVEIAVAVIAPITAEAARQWHDQCAANRDPAA